MFIHSGECRAFIRKKANGSLKILQNNSKLAGEHSCYYELFYHIKHSQLTKSSLRQYSQNAVVTDNTNERKVKDANIVGQIFCTQLCLIA